MTEPWEPGENASSPPTAKRTSRLSKIVAVLLPTGWATLIFFFSSLSFPRSHGLPAHADKVVHVLEFAVLAALLARALLVVTARSLPSGSKLVWLAVVLSTLYGLSDEVHQSFVPGRDASAWDVLADGIGALLAGVLVLAAGKRRQHAERIRVDGECVTPP